MPPVEPVKLIEVERRQAMLTARIIAGAMMGGIAIFAGIIALLQTFNALPASVSGTQLKFLIILAIAMLATTLPLAIIMQRALFARNRDPETGYIQPSAYTAAIIVPFALIEGAGLLGGIISLLSGELFPGHAIMGLVLAAMIALFPRPKHLAPPPTDLYKEPEHWR